MMRAIIRISVDGEQTGVFRNQLAAILIQYGFVKHKGKTATFEHSNITGPKIKMVMGKFWKRAVNSNNNASIDHVWMYFDYPPTSSGSSSKGKTKK